jgi:hypothetical protein
LGLASSLLVMAGLVPAIHVFTALMAYEGVDARHEAGHDELKWFSNHENKTPRESGALLL